jgi:hypothetical protein
MSQQKEKEPEGRYWEIERHRNALRRVCKAFDVYLSRFAHRFVRIVDVYHGHVAEMGICVAVRISFSSQCHDCRGALGCRLAQTRGRVSTLISALADQKLQVQIVTGHSMALTDILFMAYQRMPSLRIIMDNIRDEIISVNGMCLVDVLNSIPRLQFLVISPSPSDFSWPSFRAENLTTLEYIKSRDPFPKPLGNDTLPVQLPALRHLRFLSSPSRLQYQLENLAPILKTFGRQLISLQIGGRWSDVAETVLPAEYWQLCPRLERLDIALRLDVPPPFGHPLHTISVFNPDVYRSAITTKYLEPFSVSLLNSTSLGLRRIILQQKWRETEFSENGVDQRAKSWIQACATLCEERDISFEDVDTVAFKSRDSTASRV